MPKKKEVAVVMGSASDLKVMRPAITLLQDWNVPVEVKVVSAHRTPEFMQDYATKASSRGIKVIIAGSGRGGSFTGDASFNDNSACNRSSHCFKKIKRIGLSFIYSANAKGGSCSHCGH